MLHIDATSYRRINRARKEGAWGCMGNGGAAPSRGAKTRIAYTGQNRGFAPTCFSLTVSNNLLKIKELGLRTFAFVCYDLPNVVSYLIASERRADKGNVHDGPKINQSKQRAHPCTGPNDLGLQSKGLRRPKAKGIGRLLHPRLPEKESRQRWHTIGRHGSPWTPDLARKEVLRILWEVIAGGDPAAERSAMRKAATVADLCDQYLRDAGSGCCLCAGTLQKRRQHS
jgi:hypothetical protein